MSGRFTDSHWRERARSGYWYYGERFEGALYLPLHMAALDVTGASGTTVRASRRPPGNPLDRDG